MFHNAEHTSRGTVPTEAFPAPIAFAASEIDFSNDPARQKLRIIGSDHFTHKFMSGSTSKAVVTALELEIGVANAPRQQSNEGKSLWPLRTPRVLNLDTPIFEMDRKHYPPSAMTL